ncbi:hypothetical protein VNI00_007209 [Paramarasmius palmivorus]|uniref:Epoxide hydrolase N-terminal domain-containing protein n=1 Tax=Paramarasmius palmivorus TaxID=297713 RepID=A0AAW0D0N9_9AGAR
MASFKIAISDEALDLLKKKLELTCLPDEIEDAGWDYGAPLADIRRLVARWKDGYDWRKHEKALNEELPQFTRDIEVEGHGVLNIHYIYKKSSVKNAIPLLFVHGWPGSFIEVRKVLPLLTADEPGKPSFDVVALGMPGYGFSEGTKKMGFDLSKYAEVGHKLMQSARLLSVWLTQGGDWGAFITRMMASVYGGQHVKAWHSNMPVVLPPSNVDPAAYDEEDLKVLERTKWFQEKGNGYFQEQSTQPQTLGYSLADSPAGLLAWIYEKLVVWTDSYPWEDDEGSQIYLRAPILEGSALLLLVLTWISIYWFSRAGPAASVRGYYENAQAGEFANIPTPSVPTGYSFFPKEIGRGPKPQVDQIPVVLLWYTDKNIVFQSHHKSGGHFAAHEKPNELVEDLRNMFGKGGPAFGVVPGKDGYA